MEILIGLFGTIIISFIAYSKNSLSKNGVIAAIILGTAIFSFGGFIPFTLMIVFFISSSILSKVGKKRKKNIDNILEKGDRRDYIQVIANGGIALIFLVIFQITKDIRFFIASAVSFAASNSDTWGSEVGVLSKGKTISILTGKRIEKGVSGGISLLGTMAAFLGATLIGVVYTALHIVTFGLNNGIVKNLFAIIVLGFFGSLVDSILGVAFQGQYIDKRDGHITEKKYTNGEINKLIKGYFWVNNDVVNIVSNLIVTTVAIFIL